MEESTEFTVIAFTSIGVIVAMTPMVVMSIIKPSQLVKLIFLMALTALSFGLFYTIISNHSFMDIMLLKRHPPGWPPRAISVPYTMIVGSVVLLFLANIISLFKAKRPNKAIQPGRKKRAG